MADQPDRKDAKPPAGNAGKVSHDARGNAVWQWASSTTRHALDSTSRMLKRLEVPGLRLLDDPKPEDKPPVDPLEALKAQRAAGFDPYEGRSKQSAAPQQKAGSKAPSNPTARPSPSSSTRPPVARPVGKPSLLSRLFGKARGR